MLVDGIIAWTPLQDLVLDLVFVPRPVDKRVFSLKDQNSLKTEATKWRLLG